MTGLDTLAAMAREKKEEMDNEERSQANSSDNTSTEKPSPPAVVQSSTMEQPILPNLEGAAASALQQRGMTQQQLQGILASGILGGGKGMSQQQALALLALQANPSTALALQLQQQFNNLQYLQALQQQAQMAVALQLQAGGAQGLSASAGGEKEDVSATTNTAKSPSALSQQQQSEQKPASGNHSMKPPLPPSQASAAVTSISPGGLLASGHMLAVQPTTDMASVVMSHVMEDKKSLKRAANRRSAQLSRKRKKVFIEELKEENDELRRKEEILRSIPDLIVVFDSAGKVGFVSHSVSRFLSFTPKELEGTSFWDRLCDDSVRLLKAAFMDALAARLTDSETTTLGSGCWELRLVDRDGSQKLVTMNAVVHFNKDTPECVCSIRPSENNGAATNTMATSARTVSTNNSSLAQGNGTSSSDGTSSSSNSTVESAPPLKPHIKPHQSVISCSSSSGSGSESSGPLKKRPPQAAHAVGEARRLATYQYQISSDGDSGSDD